MPLPENANYQKDKLLIFILTADVPLGSSMIWGCHGNKGAFLQPLRLQSKMDNTWTSLVAQWLRTCLPMQGTQVRALVWEDPTCRGATKPLCNNY